VDYDITQTTTSASLTVTGFGDDSDSYDATQIIDFGSTRDRSVTFDVDPKTETVIKTKIWHNAGTDSLSDGSHYRNELVMDKTQTYDLYEFDDETKIIISDKDRQNPTF